MNRFRTPHERHHSRFAVDIRQHIWPEPLVDVLRRRAAPPRLRGWTLELAGEPASDVDPAQHDVALRVAEAGADGLDLALVSLSGPLGIESLPPHEARELLRAYHDGVGELPAPFRAWAAACLTQVDPRALERELDRGFVAGLAPLHGERFAARAGGRSVLDPDVFLDISSYGTRAVDATVRVLGIDVLVNGSDRPYAAPARPELGAAALSALRGANPLRYLHPQKEVLDALAVACRAQS